MAAQRCGRPAKYYGRIIRMGAGAPNPIESGAADRKGDYPFCSDCAPSGGTFWSDRPAEKGETCAVVTRFA